MVDSGGGKYTGQILIEFYSDTITNLEKGFRVVDIQLV